jgi:hypothetical protein
MERGGSFRKRTPIKGVTGFVSSHPCERLLYEGHDTPCLDNFYTGTQGDIPHHLYPYITLAGKILNVHWDILLDDWMARTVDLLSDQLGEPDI